MFKGTQIIQPFDWRRCFLSESSSEASASVQIRRLESPNGWSLGACYYVPAHCAVATLYLDIFHVSHPTTIR